ncbi:MAG TPA: hypothetical protein VGS12_07545 [Caulobacteraceae bacterium]|nr:hypothetical protein [Caulobacteraceae bacterium]
MGAIPAGATTGQAQQKPAPGPDDLTLTVGSAAISGWTGVRVTLGMERCPSDFEIRLTERFPGEAAAIVVHAGDPCTVKLGSDLVVTGYVDRFEPSYAAGRHELVVAGRGKCQDLVDCSAEWPTGQISGASALEIAQKLCKPYGITASSSAPAGPQIPQFNLMLGDPAWDIIERICRYSALVPYEGPDGNLILAQVGTASAASGFKEGVNVISASVAYTMGERFSEIDAFLTAVDTFSDTGGEKPLQTATDPNVPRHRKKYIVAEAAAGGIDIAKKRALWEVSRRAGRATRVQLTTDSWRDSAGALWKPNLLSPADLPGLKLSKDSYVIGEVTFRRDDEGTQADLVLMPPAAFSPEPILLVPEFADAQPNPPGQ